LNYTENDRIRDAIASVVGSTSGAPHLFVKKKERLGYALIFMQLNKTTINNRDLFPRID
jgi:hypothetical protein